MKALACRGFLQAPVGAQADDTGERPIFGSIGAWIESVGRSVCLTAEYAPDNRAETPLPLTELAARLPVRGKVTNAHTELAMEE